METRISFFIVAGFLVPGIVFGLALTPLALEAVSKSGDPIWLSPLLAIESDAVPVAVITFLGFGFLACALAVGILFSDLYFKLLELAKLLRDSDREILKRWLPSDDLETLLAKDWRLQEAYVLSLTQGPDIYGNAARNRMLGASGLAILAASVIYFCSRWFMFACSLSFLGVIFIAAGAVLARRFREWIAAYAALFLVTERTVKVTPRGVARDDE